MGDQGTTLHPLLALVFAFGQTLQRRPCWWVEIPPRAASLLPEERESGDVNSPSVTHLPALSGLPGLRFLCGDMEILTGPPPPRGAVGLASARLCTDAWCGGDPPALRSGLLGTGGPRGSSPGAPPEGPSQSRGRAWDSQAPSGLDFILSLSCLFFHKPSLPLLRAFVPFSLSDFLTLSSSAVHLSSPSGSG